MKRARKFIFFLTVSFFLISLISCASKVPIDTLELEKVVQADETQSEEILSQPKSIKKDADNNLLVLDSGNNRVVRFSAEGKYLSFFGGVGQGPGELLNPEDFDIDAQGNIYIVEDGNKRVSIFDRHGRYRKSWSIKNSPTAHSICVKDSNCIVINQPQLYKPLFRIYNNQGTCIDSIGITEPFENLPLRGVNPVATKIFNEAFAGFFPDGRLVILFNNRPLIQIYDPNYIKLMEKTIKSKEMDYFHNQYRELLNKKKKEIKPNVIYFMKYFNNFEIINDHVLALLAGSDKSKDHYFYIFSHDAVLEKKLRWNNQDYEFTISSFCSLGDKIACICKYEGVLFFLGSPKKSIVNS